MSENRPRITASNDRITIAFDRKIRLGPLHTLIEGYLDLSKDHQAQILAYIEAFLSNSDVSNTPQQNTLPETTNRSFHMLKTKKDKILHIMRAKAFPNFLTAREVQDVYNFHFKDELVSISTIQQTLSRLVKEGIVEQQGKNPIEYRFSQAFLEEIPVLL